MQQQASNQILSSHPTLVNSLKSLKQKSPGRVRSKTMNLRHGSQSKRQGLEEKGVCVCVCVKPPYDAELH